MTKQHKTGTEGFTVLELMIVVSVFTIIMAIAVPNMLRSRMQSNEVATIQNLRSITSAQAAFSSSNKRYAAEFDELCNVHLPYLAQVFLEQPMAGYDIVLAGEDMQYTVVADPVEWGITGHRGFFCDTSGILRYEYGASADEESSVL